MDAPRRDFDEVYCRLGECSLQCAPHAFVNKRGQPIVIKLLDSDWEQQLRLMYLAYRPRGSFNGLPPIDDAACDAWVGGMIDTAINVVALSFHDEVVGHAALFPMSGDSCEMLLVVAPAFQNCGIGTQITQCSLQLCSELGIERIWLSVETTNLRARHVYEKCGFDVQSDRTLEEIDMSCDLKRFREILSAPVSEVMSPEVVAVTMDESCKSAVELFILRGVASLPVVDPDRRLVGILCETDMIRPTDYRRRVGEVMTREVFSISIDTPLDKAARMFLQRRIRSIPVIGKDGRLAGIVGRKDILKYYAVRLGPNWRTGNSERRYVDR
jgi:CBS domain-containing protein/GNAT superfamily N-acetyltransferase